MMLARCFRFLTCILILSGIVSCKKTEINVNDFLSGSVLDADGQGVQNITIKIGDSGYSVTNALGNWNFGTVQVPVEITPIDSGYFFTPASLIATDKGIQPNFRARKKAFPSMLPESFLSWLSLKQLSNGLIETSEKNNFVSLYDNGLAATVFIASYQYDKAEKIFDFFNSHIDDELLAGTGGFSQFRDSLGNPTGQHWLGDNAWLLIALFNYAAKVDAVKYSSLTTHMMNWITGLQDSVDGGVWGGYTIYGNKIPKITEGEIDAFIAMPSYTDFHHKLLNYFATYRWDSVENLLIACPGCGDYVFALDNHTWGYCGINGFPYSVIEKANRYLNTQKATIGGEWVTGFAPDIDKDVVWLEGTGQMVVAYQKAGYPELANFYLKEMMKPVFTSTCYPGSKALPYATNPGTSYGAEPFWEGVDDNPATSSTCWYILGMLQYDPMKVSYSKDIPLEDQFWLP